jgi:hypothetical protein
VQLIEVAVLGAIAASITIDEGAATSITLTRGKRPIARYLSEIIVIVRTFRSSNKLKNTLFCCDNIAVHEGAILQNTSC